MDIRNAKKVVFNDETNYSAETCRNGGDYAFYEVYERIGENKWKCYYDTSSEFYYCPVCGSFENHYDEESDDFVCGEFEIISDEEMIKRIENFEESDDNYITIE